MKTIFINTKYFVMINLYHQRESCILALPRKQRIRVSKYTEAVKTADNLKENAFKINVIFSFLPYFLASSGCEIVVLGHSPVPQTSGISLHVRKTSNNCRCISAAPYP